MQMHRVNTKKRRVVILRFVTYGITLTLTIITTVLLLYLALGYRLGKSGHVVKNGLLLVDNRPESAQVFVNNELKDTSAPSRFVLPAAQYDVALKLKGYRDWSKRVKVSASKVREVNYPLLIPSELTPRTIQPTEAPDAITQSQDRKILLTYSSGTSTLQRIELDPKSPKTTVLNIGTAASREAGKLGNMRFIEWSLDSKHVLIEQVLPSGARSMLSLDTTKPEEVINISARFGSQAPEDLHYAGGNTDEVYGLKNGILSRYNIKDSTSAIILQNIYSYTPYADNTILFARLVTDGLQIGIKQDDQESVIEQGAVTSAKINLKYAEYDGHFYFVIAREDADKVTIYRDPLQKPVLAKQLPFVTLAFLGTSKIDFSGSAQFILMQSGKNALVYDLEDVQAYQYGLPYDLAAGSLVTWVDDHHLQVVDSSQQSHMLDYDGTNSQQISAVRPGTKLYYANNYKHFYSLTSSENQNNLLVTSLIVGKE